MKKLKIITLIAFIFLISMCVYLIIRDRQFPVKYMLCNVSYEDCFVSSKYHDMRSCEKHREKGQWLCDSTNLNDIRCKIQTYGSTATSYCKK